MNDAVPSRLAGLHLVTADALDLPQARGPLPQLASGQTHEWFLSSEWGVVRAGKRGYSRGRGVWHPPLMVLAHFAGEAARKEGGRRIVWIGRNCWPTLQVLCAISGKSVKDALEGSLFLDPLTDAERYWGIGQALRCAGVAAVVADGSGMDATVSRRLQLAAESGKVLGLLARPAWESREESMGKGRSWAATRWEVKPRISTAMGPGWEITLRSCRGQHREQDAPHTWFADWSYQVFRETGALNISPGMGRGVTAPSEGTADGAVATA